MRVRAVTSGHRQHFFGYYDKHQWDESGARILGLETDVVGRSPGPEDVGMVGVVDVDSGRFEAVAETRAWCWQQGCMLQWLPGAVLGLSDAVIFNDRRGDRFVSVCLDLESGTRRELPWPIYALSADGRTALSLNFARLASTRPGYGYAGVVDPNETVCCPSDDGVFVFDLERSERRLVVPIAELAETDPEPSMQGVKHWVNHLLFNQRGDRFIFLHRWAKPNGSFHTRMYTADRDGSRRHRVPMEDASHFIWDGDDALIVWAKTPAHGDRFYRCVDRSDQVEVVGEGVLTRNGHITVSPDREWLLTDEYPNAERLQPLMLVHRATGRRYDLGAFHAPRVATAELRCDLHPRFSRDGRKVCIDSAHEGSRQMYVLDVSSIVDARR